MLILMLMLATTHEVSGQATSTATTTQQPVSTTTSANETATAANSQEIREKFSNVLRQHPRDLRNILALDPTLVSDEPFMARYPDIAQFVAQHPEIRRNPYYYVREFELPREHARSAVADAIEKFSIVSIFVLIAFTLAWLVRTIIEQKRWNHLSRRQSDVHNKILDRFNSSEEVLAYVKSPAGTRFLESAPIPVHSDPVRQNAPLARVLWSIQIGVIVVAAALAMLLVSGRFAADGGELLFAMGAIGVGVGGGFIASAIVSIIVSRRLGLWQEPGTAPGQIADDAELMR
jgi:hypothetical protein